MRRLGWIVLAALASSMGACTDDDALYTSTKLVPGYTPSGYTANVPDSRQDRNRNADWRER
jgi:hypothetical protein